MKNKETKIDNFPVKTELDKFKTEFTDDEIRSQIKSYGQDFTTPREKIRLLYLDDERDELESFRSLYRRVFDVHIASTPERAYEIMKTEDVHVVLTDQRMDLMTGVEFLESIVEDHPDPVRILVTGYSDITAVINSINQGRVYKYISKPYPREAMQKSIENAAEVYFLRKDRKELIQKLTRACSQLEFLLRQSSLDV
ncbi:response regulator [Flavobacteriales bacterium]|jgi:DNA-binding NtrC family response regulator|nr:response regulator [Flavobacteriales bacterium]